MRVDLTGGSVAVERPHPMDGDAVGRFAVRGGDRVEEETFPDTERLHGRYSYGHSMAAFLDSLRAGTEPPHSGRNNLRTMGIMEAAYLSAGRGGSAVTVTEALGGYELDAPGAARWPGRSGWVCWASATAAGSTTPSGTCSDRRGSNSSPSRAAPRRRSPSARPRLEPAAMSA